MMQDTMTLLDDHSNQFDVLDFLVNDDTLYEPSNGSTSQYNCPAPFLYLAELPLPVVEVEPMSSHTSLMKHPFVVDSEAAFDHLHSKPSSPSAARTCMSPSAARTCTSPTAITADLLTPARQRKLAKPTARRFKRETSAETSSDTGSDIEDRKEDRKQRNRDSAAESRKRKRQHVEDLEALLATLKRDAAALTTRNAELRRECAQLADGGSN